MIKNIVTCEVPCVCTEWIFVGGKKREFSPCRALCVRNLPPPPEQQERRGEYQSDAVHRFQAENFPQEASKSFLLQQLGGKIIRKGNILKQQPPGKEGGNYFSERKKKRTRSSVSVGKSAGKDVCYLFIPCCVHVDVIFIRSLFIMCWLVYCLFEAQMF